MICTLPMERPLTASANVRYATVLDTIGHLDEQAALQSRIIRNALRMEPGMEDAHPTASVSSDTDAEHYPIELGTRIADTAILPGNRWHRIMAYSEPIRHHGRGQDRG